MKKKFFAFLCLLILISSLIFPIEIEAKSWGYEFCLEKKSAEALKNFLNETVDKISILSFLEILTTRIRPELKFLAILIAADLIHFRNKLNDNMGIDGVCVRVWGIAARKLLVTCTSPFGIDLLPKKWRNYIDAATTTPLYWKIRPRGKYSSEVENELFKKNSEISIEPLVEALNDENFKVRASAARALGKLKSEKSIEPLIKALKDEDYRVRVAVAESLGIIKSKKAIKPLIQTLKDENAEVRAEAAKALGEIQAN